MADKATILILCTIPLFHSGRIGNCLLDALILARRCVILDRTSNEGQTLLRTIGRGRALPQSMRPRGGGQIRAKAIRFILALLYQFSGTGGAARARHHRFQPGARLCISSGDILPKRTYERFLARFGQPIWKLHGSTQAWPDRDR